MTKNELQMLPIAYFSNEYSKLFFFIHTYKGYHILGNADITFAYYEYFAQGTDKIIRMYQNYFWLIRERW